MNNTPLPSHSAASTPPSAQAYWPSRSAVLQGTTVKLVALESAHTKALWPVVSASEVLAAPFWTHIHAQPWRRYEDFAANVQRKVESLVGVYYAIVSVASSLPIGWVGLWRVDLAARVVDVGVFVPAAEMQKTRVATEAVRSLLEYAFGELGFVRARWVTNRGNENSIRAAKRLGFVPEDDTEASEGAEGDLIYAIDVKRWRLVKMALDAWLDSSNFDKDGRQLLRLEDVRQQLSVTETRGVET